MSLKNCEDCGQSYSEKADQCIHCGAPNQEKESGEFLGTIIGFIIIGCIVYANIDSVRSFFKEILNLANVGVVSENDLEDCNNDRIKNSMKQSFNESPHAQTYHLKAIMIETVSKKSTQDYLLSCNAKMTLNNSEIIHYTFNFSKQDNQYLIEGIPRY